MIAGIERGHALHTFDLAPRIRYGEGAARCAGPELRRLGVTHALVVTDRGVLDAGVCAPVLDSAAAEGIACDVFCELGTNPTDLHVMAAAALYRSEGCDGIVGVGGGSALDVAKSVAVVVSNGGRINDYEDGGRPVTSPHPPLVLAPTTAGTGSETVGGAFILDSERLFKMHVVAVPADVALCDPVLTLSVPAHVTAATGLDALSHAIGAYGSDERHRQPLTDGMALYAISEIARWLPRAVSDGADQVARSHMMVGSLSAGISMKGGGIADHAFAHGVNALFNVHHGLACAMFLAEVMQFNLPHFPERLAAVARAMGVEAAGRDSEELGQAGIDAVRDLVADLGVPSLRKCGVGEGDLPRLAAKVMEDQFSLGLNPVPMGPDDVDGILRRALVS